MHPLNDTPTEQLHIIAWGHRLREAHREYIQQLTTRPQSGESLPYPKCVPVHGPNHVYVTIPPALERPLSQSLAYA